MRYYSTQLRKYQPGETIFSENSPCDGMYIINKGSVSVIKTITSSHGNSRQVELCKLGPKNMFGEMAMIDKGKRSATVKANEFTECTVITKQVFEDQLSKLPPWMVTMIKIVVHRLRETNDKLRTTLEKYNGEDTKSTDIITVNDARQVNKLKDLD